MSSKPLRPPDRYNDGLDDLPLADGYRLVLHAMGRALAPPEPIQVSAWAEENRVLSSRNSSIPGRWRNSRTPYLQEIMDALHEDDPCESVTVMAGAQLGKTEVGLNWIGWVIDQCPGPMLIVHPTVELAKRASKQRVDPMIEQCAALSKKVQPARARDSGNTVLTKEFTGGILVMTGANSAVGLRSMPARFLLFEEMDAYEPSIDDEGDPVRLAELRASNFSRRKIYRNSTTTIEGGSRIAEAFEAGDQRYFHVPCPECQTYQVLRWELLKWEKAEDGKAAWAKYCCEACGVLIPEHRKTSMLERGRWVPKHPDRTERARSYHLSTLYSPLGWVSWMQLADEWIECQGHPEKHRAFVNGRLAETWKRKGEQPKWERLYNRREKYAVGTVPHGALMLTAGVDVQQDRLVYEVVGWGRQLESWSVEFRTIPGNPSTGEPWQQLDVLLARAFLHESGAQLKIRRLAIDAGYSTQNVYNWTRKYGISRVIATIGRDHLHVAVGAPSAVDVNVAGKTVYRGAKSWPVGVSMLKEELYAWLQYEQPTDPEMGFPAGYCHFPEFDEEYFRQLTAEALVMRIVRGFRKFQWEKTRERNEALDVHVLARAAAFTLGLDSWTEDHWKSLEQSIGIGAEPGSTEAPPSSSPSESGGGDWIHLDRWRL